MSAADGTYDPSRSGARIDQDEILGQSPTPPALIRFYPSGSWFQRVRPLPFAIGDRVQLRPDAPDILDEYRAEIGDHVGEIVEDDWDRDWVVSFPDPEHPSNPRRTKAYALDNEHLMHESVREP